MKTIANIEYRGDNITLLEYYFEHLADKGLDDIDVAGYKFINHSRRIEFNSVSEEHLTSNLETVYTKEETKELIDLFFPIEKVEQVLPTDDNEILLMGLNLLEEALSNQLKREEKQGRFNDSINDTIFDIYGLKGMLKSGEVSVTLPKSIVENFVHHHGVDFPLYIGEKFQLKPKKS
jgi:hypothetical protein